MLYYRIKSTGDKVNMKPRIFVSSTFYDLKYIREELSNFIKEHDFEPIMFEEGDIGYTPGKPLDSSCYEAMKGSDMVILIIGGQYGSAATGEDTSFQNYLSVTRNEFKTAVSEGIPVYAFIDRKVYTEFDVYEVNRTQIENGVSMQFRATKDINVFRFIKEVKNIGNITITDFNKAAEIKNFLGKQWADMFKQYLKSLKKEQTDLKITNSISELQSLIKRMDVMIGHMGKKVLSIDDEYNEVVETQMVMKACDLITSTLTFDFTVGILQGEQRQEFIKYLIEIIKETPDMFNKETFLCNPRRMTIELRKLQKGDAKISVFKEWDDEEVEFMHNFLDSAGNVEALVEYLSKDENFKKLFERS